MTFGLCAVPAEAWDKGYLFGLLEATPDGGWVQVNTNKYSDAWVTGPDALTQSSESDPASIVLAWSSFGWDSRRGNLLLWGGGHANYKGNEIYVWQGANGTWTRGSVSSRVTQYGNTATYFTADDAAPQSAHTYDNNIYLPLNDMLLTFGGAAFNDGNNFSVRGANGSPVRAGPWAWDPLKADPNKVGGTTGSGYNPSTAGGQMWTNQQGRWIGLEAPTYVDGATAYAQEGGRDVVYVSASSGTGWPSLFRYEPGDIRAGQAGRYDEVGTTWNAPTFQNSAVIDSRHGLYIHTATASGGSNGLGVWDLTRSNAADPDSNRDILVTLRMLDGTPFVGNTSYGIAYDDINDKILMWDGKDRGTVWETRAAFDELGQVLPTWSVRRLASTTTAQPQGNFGTGVIGKWHFVSDLGAFVALDNFDFGARDAGVWLYRPVGWTRPGTSTNVAPVVMLTAPANGTVVMQSASVALGANASDSDGWVTRVDFYAGSTLIGSATSDPYSATWTNVSPGNYVLTAVAVDSGGASTQSAAVNLVVTSAPDNGTLTLQDGLNGYAGTRDTYLLSNYPTTNFGAALGMVEGGGGYTDLVRFAIFQSEGGPVPNGATIESATLSLYKASYYDYTYQVMRMLRDWDEGRATWNDWRAGQPWSVGGAKGVGTDYAAVADATVTVGWTPQWLTADVTVGVQAMATGQPNNGWRLLGVSGNGNDKQFWSREYVSDPTLRPKLTVQYVSVAGNVPPTVSLTSPGIGTSVGAPATVLVSANASDSDGTVARVDFYAGTTLIGSDSAAPYSATWSNVTAGTYVLTAVAVDDRGATATSSPVTLTVTAANVPPTVSLTSPANGTSVAALATVPVSANAADGDGTVSRVDFYAGTTLIGSDTTEPYSATWSDVAAGSYTLTAVAVDNGGASTTSSAVTLTVTPPTSGTVALQEGLNGYAGTRDTFLSSYYRTTNYGTNASLPEAGAYTDLVRFAIFQSEGGPVPNGATIVTATLSLYKASDYDYTYQVTRMLRDWQEGQATWNEWRTGQTWSVAGAKGVGSDYASVADATVAVGWAPQWLTADVTTGVQAMAAGQPNHGWRLVGVSGNNNDKLFLSREYAADPTLRPKLVIQYGGGTSNVPPTVSLTSPSNETSATAPATVLVSADASDTDGTVSRVDFYAGATLIGSDSTAPYSVTWSNVAAFLHVLTAVAVDNAGASTTSSPVTLAVTPAPTRLMEVLQDGLKGYAGTRDTYLLSSYPAANFGTSPGMVEGGGYTDLVRFAIFEAEGGPVPNGTTIVSATLSLYKASSYDYTYQVMRMLRDWDEGQATWNEWRAGQPWSVAGANGAGTDYAAMADATVAVGWAPQWLTADVTAGVQAMAAGQPNNGWRLLGVSGNGNDKQFWSREFATDPALRPKLFVRYQ